MTFYIHRHGLRQDIVDKMTGNGIWRSSPRFAQHFNDIPLFDPAEPAIHNNAGLITEPLDCIYSSPAARCLETSAILAKSLQIPIVVEYGLMESQLFWSNALNDDFLHTEMTKPVRIGDNLYTENIDPEMLPERLAIRFPMVDTSQSIIAPDAVPTAIDFATWALRQKALLEIWATRHTNLLVVAHAAHSTNLLPFVAQRSLDQFDDYVNGNHRTGTLAVCCPKKDIAVYQNGAKIYENRIID